jgi:hypothetical protein
MSIMLVRFRSRVKRGVVGSMLPLGLLAAARPPAWPVCSRP